MIDSANSSLWPIPSVDTPQSIRPIFPPVPTHDAIRFDAPVKGSRDPQEAYALSATAVAFVISDTYQDFWAAVLLSKGEDLAFMQGENLLSKVLCFTGIGATLYCAARLAVQRKTLTKTDKVFLTSSALAGIQAFFTGVSTLLSTIPAAGLKAASLSLGAAAVVLLTVAYAVQGRMEFIRGRRFSAREQAATKILETVDTIQKPVTHQIIKREQLSSRVVKINSYVRSGRSWMSAAGVITVAALAILLKISITAGAAAILMTPVGWVGAGVLLVSFGIGLGIMVYQKHAAKQVNTEGKILSSRLREVVKTDQLKNQLIEIDTQYQALENESDLNNSDRRTILAQRLSKFLEKEVALIPQVEQPKIATYFLKTIGLSLNKTDLEALSKDLSEHTIAQILLHQGFDMKGYLADKKVGGNGLKRLYHTIRKKIGSLVEAKTLFERLQTLEKEVLIGKVFKPIMYQELNGLNSVAVETLAKYKKEATFNQAQWVEELFVKPRAPGARSLASQLIEDITKT